MTCCQLNPLVHYLQLAKDIQQWLQQSNNNYAGKLRCIFQQSLATIK